MGSINRFKKAASVLVVTSAMILLSGCVGFDNENKTVLELKEDGKVIQTIVDDVTNGMTGEELEGYVVENIKNIQTASDSISLEACRVKNDKLNLIINYGTTNAYINFNNVGCFDGTVKEAYDAGYNMNRTFKTLNGVEIPYFALVPLCTDCRVFIVEEPVTVKLPGELFIVSEGVTVESDGTIKVNKNPDTTVPEVFQTTTLEPVFLIYKVK